jgi:putative transposase
VRPALIEVCQNVRPWCSAEKTMKHDYVAFMPKPDAATAARNLAIAFEHYDEKPPRSALKYRSPREFRRRTDSSTLV